MKAMKRFIERFILISIIVLSILLFTWAVGWMVINQDNIHAAGAARAVESAQRGRYYSAFVESFFASFGSFLSAAMAVLVFSVAALIVLYIYRRLWKDRNLPTDGTYALQRVHMTTIDENGNRIKVLSIHNPNLALAPSLTQVLSGLMIGKSIYTGNELSERGQLQAKQVERAANNLQAATFSDNFGRLTAGVMGRILSPKAITDSGSSRSYGSENKMLDVAEETQETPSVPLISISEAYKQSNDTEWVIGQSERGDLAVLDLSVFPHGGIIGQTRTGKTSGAGMMIAGHALRSGCQLVILDGDLSTGGDWSPFASVAEYHKCAPETFPYQVEMLYNEFRRREKQGFSHRLFVMIEEYGDVNRNLARKDRQRTNTMLESMLSKAGKFNVNLFFIDQFPNLWPELVFQNARAKITYKLEEAGKLKLYKMDELADRGEFYFRNKIYKSFHVSPHREKVIQFAKKTFPLLIDESKYPVSEDLDGDSRPYIEIKDLGTVKGAQAASGATEYAPTQAQESRIVESVRVFVDSFDECDLLVAPPPNGTLREIMEYVEEMTGQSVSKGYVSKVLAKFREEEQGE